MNGIERYQKRLDRERKARNQAESLLENKSRELFQANRELSSTLQSMEQTIAARTEALKMALAEAERLNEVKSCFLATISHEIRTPMNIVAGMTQLLLSMDHTELQGTYLSRIDSASENLIALLNDFLDLSKIEAGELSLAMQPIDVVETAQNVIDLFSSRATEKGLRLVSEAHGDINGLYECDPNRLKQILANLIGNAIKFTATGEIRLQIRKKDEVAGRHVFQFDVHDSGIGISKDDCGQVFQLFSQVDNSATRRFEGTGLGLAICKNLTEMMDGNIGVESCLGRGSRFWFTLPMKSYKEMTAPTVPVNLKEELPHFGGLRVMLAEDNEANRELAQIFLNKLGCDVETATDGREAVELAAKSEFDVILMDMQMPELSGLEATRLIRTLCGPVSRTPIIALTANAMHKDIENCQAAGMQDFVAKPIRIGDLARALTPYASDGEQLPL